MRIALPDVTALALFAANVVALAAFGLAVSGHFPLEHRREPLRGSIGAAVLWASIFVSCVAAAAALRMALLRLPGYAVVIAGGTALLVGGARPCAADSRWPYPGR